MSRNRTEPFLRILAVEDGSPSPYAKIEVALGGETLVVRWGLDADTFPHLKKAFTTRCFDGLPGTAYEYFLLLSFSGERSSAGPKTLGYVECRNRERTKNVSFPCSSYFISNLKWMASVSSIAELKSLEWSSRG